MKIKAKQKKNYNFKKNLQNRKKRKEKKKQNKTRNVIKRNLNGREACQPFKEKKNISK